MGIQLRDSDLVALLEHYQAKDRATPMSDNSRVRSALEFHRKLQAPVDAVPMSLRSRAIQPRSDSPLNWLPQAKDIDKWKQEIRRARNIKLVYNNRTVRRRAASRAGSRDTESVISHPSSHKSSASSVRSIKHRVPSRGARSIARQALDRTGLAAKSTPLSQPEPELDYFAFVNRTVGKPGVAKASEVRAASSPVSPFLVLTSYFG